VIPRNEIVQTSHKECMRGDVRLFGVGGLFGRIGWFWNKSIGRYLAFVKDGNSLIEIKTSGRTYVVSCDNYEQVLINIKG
jgi:hypothetical protein